MHLMEIWKTILEHPTYEVSNYGRVKSFNGRKERILKIRRMPLGNGFVSLTKGKNCFVSRLVYQAFKGPLVEGLHIDHIDHNPTNDHVDNLQQITHRENLTKDLWRKPQTSQYIGVSWCKQTKKWRACISINGKNNSLGRFKTELEAHKAYQNKLNEILT